MRVSASFNSNQSLVNLLLRFVPNSTMLDNVLHVGLFNGTMPTDDQILALLGSSQLPTWTAAAVAPFATASNFLGDLACLSIVPTIDPDALSLVIPLSSQANNFVIATSGTPTWFMMRLCAAASAGSAFANWSASTTCSALVWGTVGDENSTADLKIVGGTVTANVAVRPSDIRIKL
ncbi:hypothetical protein MPK74_gp086 [Erwinia phage pEa_SNUABM_7]|uniref:Uncharacterized protein n=1 Tax=Erwinia phage pEa_SNUABM_7 TaxID=2866695 RepID=A0AAE7WSW4_9CAUD|nr:hypothetical protein MPK74_gp086 [Erwinia phage pEa_SNUABM_7]QYW04754.1 hypothetical protein pEaSNUABM7_00086 [Erwinia phage pEa_SNUABM_7]